LNSGYYLSLRVTSLLLTLYSPQQAAIERVKRSIKLRAFVIAIPNLRSNLQNKIVLRGHMLIALHAAS